MSRGVCKDCHRPLTAGGVVNQKTHCVWPGTAECRTVADAYRRGMAAGVEHGVALAKQHAVGDYDGNVIWCAVDDAVFALLHPQEGL